VRGPEQSGSCGSASALLAVPGQLVNGDALRSLERARRELPFLAAAACAAVEESGGWRSKKTHRRLLVDLLAVLPPTVIRCG
jgi:hypothetical protein